MIFYIVVLLYRNVLRAIYEKRTGATHIGDPDEAWTAVEGKTYYIVTCRKVHS
jgi:hypothetical protein